MFLLHFLINIVGSIIFWLILGTICYFVPKNGIKILNIIGIFSISIIILIIIFLNFNYGIIQGLILSLIIIIQPIFYLICTNYILRYFQNQKHDLKFQNVDWKKWSNVSLNSNKTILILGFCGAIIFSLLGIFLRNLHFHIENYIFYFLIFPLSLLFLSLGFIFFRSSMIVLVISIFKK